MARMTYVNDKTKSPKTTHFAALVFDTIHIPGDERSRTHPGHGYPDSIESIVKYIAFTNKEEMVEWVEKEESSSYRKENYMIVEIKPLNVVRKIAIE